MVTTFGRLLQSLEGGVGEILEQVKQLVVDALADGPQSIFHSIEIFLNIVTFEINKI